MHFLILSQSSLRFSHFFSNCGNLPSLQTHTMQKLPSDLTFCIIILCQELETQLAAKEASLPSEPSSADENAVTLLVRMPDGSRRGRRFLRSDKLQVKKDLIEIVFSPLVLNNF